MEEEKRSGLVYRSLFWPLLLIGVGLVFLLSNMGIIERPSLNFLLRLWPVFLIAIGLDIIFARRSPLLGALLGAAAVALVIALLLLAPSLGLERTPELKTEQFSVPMAGVTSARVDLDLDRYPTTVDAVADSSVLIEAELDTLNTIEFVATGEGEKVIRVSEVQDDTFDFSFIDLVTLDASWEIGLNPSVPLDLIVDVGSGSVNLELEDFLLTDLDIDGGSGSVTVKLPGSDTRYTLNIEGGSGRVNLLLAKQADLEARVEVGSGSLSFVIGSGSNIQADIDGGSGSTTIELPNNAMIRIVIDDGGSGSVRVPGRLELIDDMGDGDSNTGVWETVGYSSAENRIEIIFDPGSGSFSVR